MARTYAYLGKEKHEFKTRMRKKGRWIANCTCGKMLEKVGGQREVYDKWRDHISAEAERRDLGPHWYLDEH